MTSPQGIAAGTAAAPVSVIMPFADAAGHLPAALAGLDALRYPNLGFVLVDDGSSDGSAEFARSWSAGRDDVTVVAMPRRSGVAAARDAGTAAATGEYVWFCDCDDEWDPWIVDRMVAAAIPGGSPGPAGGPPADLVCCRAQRHEAGGRIQVMEGAAATTRLDPGELAAAMLSGRVRGYLWNKLIRRDVLVAAVADARRRTRLSSQDDFLLVLDIARHARAAVLIPFIGYRYLERAGSISTGSALRLENTGACADAALAELPARAAGRAPEAGFRTWFHLVPCLTTPVHQRWPAEQVAEVHGRLLPRLTLAGIMGAWRLGHRRAAVHAVVLKVLGPIGAYPGAYRLMRAIIDGAAAMRPAFPGAGRR